MASGVRPCPPNISMRPLAARLADSARTASVRDRKSTRLNSSHLVISYAVFCLKKKKQDAPGALGFHCCVVLCPAHHTLRKPRLQRQRPRLERTDSPAPMLQLLRTAPATAAPAI